MDLNSWNNQTIKPKEIILSIDSKSRPLPSYTSTISVITYISYKDVNLGARYNEAVEKYVKTEAFICTDCDVHPCSSCGFFMIKFSNPTTVITPTLVNIKEYDPDLNISCGEPNLYITNQYGFPCQFFMAYKSTFLWYNEIYNYSYYDSDLNQRMAIAKYIFMRTPTIWYQHVRHERKEVENLIQRNKLLYEALIPIYCKYNITLLKERYKEP